MKHLNELKNHLKNIFSGWDSICKSTASGEKTNFFRILELYDDIEENIKKKCSINNEKDCTRNFIECAPIEVLQNKKILYDFLQYYIYPNEEWSKIEENEKKEYCKYITHIFELYHKLYEEDSQWGLSRRYENELILFRSTFKKDDELSSLKLKCNIDNSLIKSFKDVKTTDMLAENNLRRPAISNSYDKSFTNIKSEYERVLEELPSFQIYEELRKDADDNTYKSTHCDNLSNSDNKIKNICIKVLRNLTKLPELDNIRNKSHKDQCLYLNFWMYDELSKIYNKTEENIFDVPEVVKLIDANININRDLIKKDFHKNKDELMKQTNSTAKFVKYYDFSKYNPCFFY
ncbi:CYIR protein [Plasmodium cynomolgi strain B]|uniref:CYIR protein n=1 Tax=Plasmodium cynomolgi (strain B) TaxID=1120755 RepID=K6UFC7_PLACD|nr:CYIR protein [Plasmodium cynomolgi strain B]GAB69871.1 CYIR protein [Plasmodium cynomolgi strain B]